TATASGTTNNTANGLCEYKSSASRPIGAAASVASTPVDAERTNTSWNGISSAIATTTDVPTTSMTEKHTAATNAAIHADISSTDVWPIAANAVAAIVTATRRLLTLNNVFSRP